MNATIARHARKVIVTCRNRLAAAAAATAAAAALLRYSTSPLVSSHPSLHPSLPPSLHSFLLHIRTKTKILLAPPSLPPSLPPSSLKAPNTGQTAVVLPHSASLHPKSAETPSMSQTLPASLPPSFPALQDRVPPELRPSPHAQRLLV